MIRGMLAALAMLGAVFVADAAVAEGPVCASNAKGKYSCSAGTFCCKVSSAVDKSGFKCCTPGDRCVSGTGCFFEVTLRSDATWSSTQRKSELKVVRDLVNEIPDAQGALKIGNGFKRFVDSDVTLVRVSLRSSPGMDEPVLGVTPGVLNVRDAFFRTENKTDQVNVLTFELGKLLWYKVNGPDTSVAQTAQGKAFQRVVDQHLGTMSVEMLQAAAMDKKELSSLRDRDLQSQFGYAVRVVLFNLDAPANASPAVKADWAKAREEMRQFLKDLFK